MSRRSTAAPRRTAAQTRIPPGNAGPPVPFSGTGRPGGWRRATAAPTGSCRTSAAGPSWGLLPAPPPRGARELDETLAQLRKLDPRCPGRLGEEAHSGHTRKRIGLEAKDVAVGAQTEVNPRVAAKFHRAMCGQRQ